MKDINACIHIFMKINTVWVENGLTRHLLFKIILNLARHWDSSVDKTKLDICIDFCVHLASIILEFTHFSIVVLLSTAPGCGQATSPVPSKIRSRWRPCSASMLSSNKRRASAEETRLGWTRPQESTHYPTTPTAQAAAAEGVELQPRVEPAFKFNRESPPS